MLLTWTPLRRDQRLEEDAGLDLKVVDGGLHGIQLHLGARF